MTDGISVRPDNQWKRRNQYATVSVSVIVQPFLFKASKSARKKYCYIVWSMSRSQRGNWKFPPPPSKYKITRSLTLTAFLSSHSLSLPPTALRRDYRRCSSAMAVWENVRGFSPRHNLCLVLPLTSYPRETKKERDFPKIYTYIYLYKERDIHSHQRMVIMSALDPLDSILFSLSKAFCSPLAVFVQIQVCFFSFKFRFFRDFMFRSDPGPFGCRENSVGIFLFVVFNL